MHLHIYYNIYIYIYNIAIIYIYILRASPPAAGPCIVAAGCLVAPFLSHWKPFEWTWCALEVHFGGPGCLRAPFWKPWDHLGCCLETFGGSGASKGGHCGKQGRPEGAKMSSRAGGSTVLLDARLPTGMARPK